MFSALRQWLPRILLVLIIWGLAVFLWGTIDAWARSQQTETERTYLTGQLPGLRRWLDTTLEPLSNLADDPRLRMGLDLPNGIASLPVQRVLYEFSYLNNQQTVYLLELSHNTLLRSPGAPDLPPDVTARIVKLQPGEHFLISAGQRNGLVYLGQRIDTPLPQQVIALMPMGLGQMAAANAPANLPGDRKLGLLMPHTTGWAWWQDGTQRLDTTGPLVDAIAARHDTAGDAHGLAVLATIPGWPGIAAAVYGPFTQSPLTMLPHVLITIWALAMTLLVLWGPTLILRHKVADHLSPLRTMASGTLGTLGGLAGRLQARLKATTAEKPILDESLMFDDDHLKRIDFEDLRESHRVRGMRLPGDRPGRKRTAEDEETARAEAELNATRERAKHVPKPAESRPLTTDSMKDIIAECLRENRVKLLYQAVFRTGDNMPVMHEVYARLVTTDGRVMQPNEFIPVATEHRMMLDLDLAVFRRVIAEHFSDERTPMTPLALNISSTSLDGISYLQEMANQGPRVLQKLAFEVRSQEMIKDPKAMRLLKDLQKHGGNLAVDYFGGGTAMLEASKTMGFNYVKMDCARFMQTDDTKKELIGLCQKAASLGLPVILEKVSSPAMITFARKVGASFMQGYALSIPKTELIIQPLAPSVGGVAAEHTPAPAS